MAKDKCIMCGKETTYDVSVPIDYRFGYIEGAGQLCYECNKDDNTVRVPKQIVKNTPNDMELGGKIRNMFYKQEGL